MAASRVAEEERRRLLGFSPAGARSSSRRSCRWWLRLFGRRRPEPIPVATPLNAEQLKRHREEWMREMGVKPGHFERLARDRRFVMDCLSHYNSMNPHMEYEPAPGEVSRHIRFRPGFTCTHGNFVARRKRSGCFPFLLPAPRTLFFFEVMRTSDFYGVVTCTPLFGPATVATIVLSPDESLACGHNETERICEMCYGRYGVLHPFPGEFAYGYRAYLNRFY